MENKIKTSIQYQISNVVLFDEIYKNWDEFQKNLTAGPAVMKEYLLKLWENLRIYLKDNDKLIIKDIEKQVSLDDFDIILNKCKDNSPVFFITFPDYDDVDAASKYVAIGFINGKIRYFTLEYSMHALTNEKCFVIGEFYIENNKKAHKNYGSYDNIGLDFFIKFVIEKLEN